VTRMADTSELCEHRDAPFREIEKVPKYVGKTPPSPVNDGEATAGVTFSPLDVRSCTKRGLTT